MKFKSILLLLVISTLLIACDTGLDGVLNLEDIQLSVAFDSQNRASAQPEMSRITPKAYSIAIKKATLLGQNDTPSFVLFESDTLAESEVFSFTSTENNAQTMLSAGEVIPAGEYGGLQIELYYLQMTLDVYLSSEDNNPVDRTMRVYFSDDAEQDGGLHQPGDITVIDGGVEKGWLMGNAYGDFTGISPRTAAYQNEGNAWYDFAGKNAKDYGPFGDVQFWAEADQPIYKPYIIIEQDAKSASSMLVEFDVANSWNYEKNEFNKFIPNELVGKAWHMDLPIMRTKAAN